MTKWRQAEITRDKYEKDILNLPGIFGISLGYKNKGIIYLTYPLVYGII